MKLGAGAWSDVFKLFDAALQVASHVREAWFERLHAPPPLKEALHRLLRDHAALTSEPFLSRLPPFVAATVDEDASLRPGKRIGAYRLVRRLGEGGMSTVWLAERDDARPLRRVALKIARAGAAQQTLRAHLRHERKVLARLDHPNITRACDGGVGPGGLPFLVLEYVEGLPLCAWCDAHRCTVAQRLAVFRELLQIIGHVHARRVLHRDLKPANTLVDAQGKVHLLDFGIAQILGEEAAATGREGPLALTPEYAAPEQIAGKALGTACDVYALGVVLFELLTGRRPYRLTRGSVSALERAILNAEVAPPSKTWDDAACATSYGASAPAMHEALHGDLDAIVLKALRKSPADRYPSAAAFEADIERYLARRPIGACTPWVPAGC